MAYWGTVGTLQQRIRRQQGAGLAPRSPASNGMTLSLCPCSSRPSLARRVQAGHKAFLTSAQLQ